MMMINVPLHPRQMITSGKTWFSTMEPISKEHSNGNMDVSVFIMSITVRRDNDINLKKHLKAIRIESGYNRHVVLLSIFAIILLYFLL